MSTFDVPADTISLAEAAKLMRVDGQSPSPVSLWRWARHGKRGVKLQVWPRGRKLVTTPEAIREFERQIAQRDHDTWAARTEREAIAREVDEDLESACRAEGI